MYYIQESDKLNKINKIFNKIKIVDDKIILPLTKEEIEKSNINKIIEITAKVKKIIRKSISSKIVLSKNLRKNKDFINNLIDENIVMADGKYLSEILLVKILDYIILKKYFNKKNDEIKISILINDLTEYMIENIKIISSKYKRVNIITNHIEKFKNLENQMNDEYGIMLMVGNNTKKGISSSDVILNIDFTSELLNKYRITEAPIIFNVKTETKLSKKGFKGININDYDIRYKNDLEKELLEKEMYYEREIYEVNMKKNIIYADAIKKIEQDLIEITYLQGNNKYI